MNLSPANNKKRNYSGATCWQRVNVRLLWCNRQKKTHHDATFRSWDVASKIEKKEIFKKRYFFMEVKRILPFRENYVTAR